jgi:VIT1/CCC1 family predicted Fe2+/Mn2+ transporter
VIQLSSDAPAAPSRPEKRVLEPDERIAEVLFGLIMVITFTGSLSVATSERDDVRSMVIGAIGCNLAWGIIDGVFYLLGALAARGSKARAIRALRSAQDPQQVLRIVSDALPLLASVLEPAELESIHQRLQRLPPPKLARLSGRDVAGAFGVFLLVFLSTFPVTLPFVFYSDIRHAMRLSNAIALAMLLLSGIAYGRAVGRSPWGFGAGMVVLGGVLVGLTIALGG